MKKIVFLFIVTAFLASCTSTKTATETTTTVTKNQKLITNEDLWSKSTFGTARLNSFHSMDNGDFYAVVNNRGAQLDKYSYKTLEKVETIVKASELEAVSSVADYKFNAEETKLIIGTESEQIYRHSSRGIYFTYDIATKKLVKISDHKIQEPTFSPDGNKVAFVFNNNIYIKNLVTNTEKQITTDGVKNKVINGITDWVYEEEFAFVKAFEWNGNSDKLAYIRFDETDVPEFSMDIFGSDLYQTQQVFKYPKAGENNAKVSLHLYNIATQNNQKVALGDKQQYYIPRIEWTKSPNTLCVTTLNRHQDNLNLLFVNGNNLQSQLVLNEKDAAYVEVKDDLTFLEDNSFIWTSEKDGFNHIYHYAETGKLINQITTGNWEVTSYYGYNQDNNQIYYQSTQDGSINRSIYAIDLIDRKPIKLNKQIGSNSAAFSNSFNYYINTFSNVETPSIYTLNDAKTGAELKTIKSNEKVKTLVDSYGLGTKEYSVIKTKDGEFNMYTIKPANFDASKKYPLFMYQYSGPGSQQVANRWHYTNDYWHFMLAQKGYIVVCVDGRGTGFKGRDFKKITQKELGKYEVQDQIEVAKILGQRAYIDESRIGIWGWSYGGFMSTNCILKGNDVFKTAIAVAPVTSWRFYDSVYTERYMQTPQENASGYDDNSPINYASMLKGNYLIVHGSGDDNVHIQNTHRMINALVKENKPFEMFLYPDRTHGIYRGQNTRLHLYNKMTSFIEKNL